jgi:hypothetical protein
MAAKNLAKIFAKKFLFLMLVVSLVFTLATNAPLLEMPSYPQNAYAEHEQEISITLDSAEFLPLSEGEGNQVNMFVNYVVDDSSLVNQKANSVMKVYATDGTLIKTSSSSDGFILNQTGSQRHATTECNSSCTVY